MKNVFNAIILLLSILVISSCAFLNKKEVPVTIDSDPGGAKIYVDGVDYGKTVKEINLIPDKNYHIKLVKEGYQDAEIILETEFSLRKKRHSESDIKRCRIDIAGSVLIVPIFSLKSARCRDFTQIFYMIDLVKIASNQQETVAEYQEPTLRNYYFPDQEKPKIFNVLDADQSNLIGDKLEMVNQEKVHAVTHQKDDNNYNKKIKDSYHTWQ